MSGKKSLDKGKRAEREVVKLLQPVVDDAYQRKGYEPPLLQRNLMQSHTGGYDIAGLEWLALEVKHHQKPQVKQWWEQTLGQASDEQEPILIYKVTGGKWRVRMHAQLLSNVEDLLVPVDIAVEDFLYYLWHRLARELEYLD